MLKETATKSEVEENTIAKQNEVFMNWPGGVMMLDFQSRDFGF